MTGNFVATMTEDEEENFPLLGHLVIYSLVDVRITPDELRTLFSNNGVDCKYFPPKIIEPDAFRRATSSVSELAQGRAHQLDDGAYLSILVRKVKSDTGEINMKVVGEKRFPKIKELTYIPLADLTFDFKTRDFSYNMLRTEQDNITQYANETLLKIRDHFEEYKTHFTGKHIREMTRNALQTTEPINMRQNRGSGGVWFISKQNKELVKAFKRLIKELNMYKCASGEMSFDTYPILDITDQREQIHSKLESQVDEEVAKTMSEISCILDDNKKVPKSTIMKYVTRIQELSEGIDKYEKLLKTNMDVSKTNTEILRKQITALVQRAEN
jgi:uncharacterized protein YecA (UPF0149 family)